MLRPVEKKRRKRIKKGRKKTKKRAKLLFHKANREKLENIRIASTLLLSHSVQKSSGWLISHLKNEEVDDIRDSSLPTLSETT